MSGHRFRNMSLHEQYAKEWWQCKLKTEGLQTDKEQNM